MNKFVSLDNIARYQSLYFLDHFFESTFLNVINANAPRKTSAPMPQILITVSGISTPNAMPLSITIKHASVKTADYVEYTSSFQYN